MVEPLPGPAPTPGPPRLEIIEQAISPALSKPLTPVKLSPAPRPAPATPRQKRRCEQGADPLAHSPRYWSTKDSMDYCTARTSNLLSVSQPDWTRVTGLSINVSGPTRREGRAAGRATRWTRDRL